MTYTEIVKSRIVPILQNGATGNRIELGAADCSALLFVIRTSVPLEPFLDLFSQLTHATILPPAPAPGPDTTTEAGALSYCPPFDKEGGD